MYEQDVDNGHYSMTGTWYRDHWDRDDAIHKTWTFDYDYDTYRSGPKLEGAYQYGMLDVDAVDYGDHSKVSFSLPPQLPPERTDYEKTYDWKARRLAEHKDYGLEEAFDMAKIVKKASGTPTGKKLVDKVESFFGHPTEATVNDLDAATNPLDTLNFYKDKNGAWELKDLDVKKDPDFWEHYDEQGITELAGKKDIQVPEDSKLAKLLDAHVEDADGASDKMSELSFEHQALNKALKYGGVYGPHEALTLSAHQDIPYEKQDNAAVFETLLEVKKIDVIYISTVFFLKIVYNKRSEKKNTLTKS